MSAARKPLSTCLDKIVRGVHSLQARRNHRPEDEEDDMKTFKRRDLLKASAAIAAASAAGGFSCIEIASATPISPPVVDRLSVRVLIDGANNLFLRPGEANGAKIEPPPRAPDYRRTLHNQWGLSLYIESSAGNSQRTMMVDFGYTPDALINNMELVGADPKRVEALIVSHGHFDHYGGLIGFLDKFRSVLPADLQGTRAAEQPGRVRDEGWARLQRQPLHAGRVARQDRAGRASARARHLFQREGPRARGHQLLRPCRDRELGAAGAGSVRRAKGACDRRRLPSWSGTGRLPQAGDRGDQGAQPGRYRADALQWGELHQCGA